MRSLCDLGAEAQEAIAQLKWSNEQWSRIWDYLQAATDASTRLRSFRNECLEEHKRLGLAELRFFEETSGRLACQTARRFGISCSRCPDAPR